MNFHALKIMWQRDSNFVMLVIIPCFYNHSAAKEDGNRHQYTTYANVWT